MNTLAMRDYLLLIQSLGTVGLVDCMSHLDATELAVCDMIDRLLDLEYVQAVGDGHEQRFVLTKHGLRELDS